MSKTARLRNLVLLALCYSTVISVMHWPLVLNLNSHVSGAWLSDNFESLWHLERAERVVFGERTDLLYEPSVYYPYGWHLASSAMTPWFAAALSPLTHIVGPVACLNVTYLGLLLIAALGAFGMAYCLTKSPSSAFVAGLIYMAAPVLTLRLRGHPHLLAGAALLPYPFICAAMFPENTRRTRNLELGALCGLALAISCLLHWYFVFIAVLPFVAFVVFCSLQRGSLPPALRWLALVAAVTALIVGPFAAITADARRAMHGDSAEFSLTESDAFSLSPDLLLAPNAHHPIWGPWSTRIFPLTGEQDVSSLGYGATLLALVAMIRSPDRRKWSLFAVAGCALILAMGTTLHLRGHRVEVILPGKVASNPIISPLWSLPHENGLPIPLPGLLLAEIVPFYRGMRVWGRFSIPLVLMWSSLAAMGLAHLSRSCNEKRTLALGFALVVVIEGWVAPYVDPFSGAVSFTDVSINRRPQLEAWLAQLPMGTAIIEYPRPDLDKMALYSQSFHRRNIVNGYMSMPPLHLRINEAVLGHVPTDASIPLLREWQVGYVVYSERQDATEELAEIYKVSGLTHVASFEEGFPGYPRTHVFAVSPGSN